MKTLFLILAILTTSVLTAPKPADYTGTWTLDMKQSKNLPPYYANIQSHRLFITQDEKHLNIAVEIKSGQGEPTKMSFGYNLDGSESKTETPVRTPDGLINVPTVLKASVADSGKLQITIDRDVKMGEKTFKGITVEDWQLSSDGKTLSIHRADDTPRGKMEADMVFVKD